MSGNQNQKVDNALIGAAGVHFVVSELSFRGLIALPTMRNTAGIDVLVSNCDGSWHANLQVKTSKNKVGFWPVGYRYKDLKGENNYYVFLRYLKDEKRFEAFLETADKVARQVEEEYLRCKKQGYAEWAPSWYLPKIEEQKLQLAKQWVDFGKNLC
jgi:lysine/ornithine N-monooxygenase